MHTRTAIAALFAASLSAPLAHADTEGLPETLRELERHAEELLGPEARAAVESLLPMIESLMQRLPMLIDNLPQYELPEIMPNGDIIIRRKRTLPKINPDAPPLPKDGIKT
jgi:hypothetical protein